MRTQRVLLPALILCMASRPLAAEVKVHDPELGITFTLPDGYEANRQLLKEKNVVQGYLLPGGEGQPFGIVVLVEKLGGTIGRHSFGASLKTPDGRTLDVTQEPWKAFRLDVVAVPEVVQGVPCVTLNVQVPLKPFAAQIKVFSSKDREPELRTLVRSILATTDGRTNWLTEEERRQRLMEGAGRLTVVLGVIGYGIYLLIRKVRDRSATRSAAAGP